MVAVMPAEIVQVKSRAKKAQSLQKNVAGLTAHSVYMEKKKESRPYLMPYTKINSKCIANMNDKNFLRCT